MRTFRLEHAPGAGLTLRRVKPKLDSQQVELIGRSILTTRLLLGGIEVALPERDRGIDLVAYLDREDEGFRACPIQLKAATAEAFSIDRKYEKCTGLLLAFVWRATDAANAEVFTVTYANALEIAEKMGWLKTASWTKRGKYSTSRPSAVLRDHLLPYRSTPALLLTQIGGSAH